jgi:hypothetical protein
MCSNTVGVELLKLPMLVQHYLEHSRKEGTSLATYLHEHYTEEADHHQDSKHERLPFKCHHVAFFQSVVVYQPKISFNLQPAIGSYEAEKIAYQTAFIPSSRLSEIWQPPKSC